MFLDGKNEFNDITITVGKAVVISIIYIAVKGNPKNKFS